MSATTPDGPRTPQAVPDPSDPAQLEAHVEETREDLAATIDALGAKLDVKSRTQQRLRGVQDAATDDHGRPTLAASAVGAAVVAALTAVVVVVVRRRR
ncbi:DUF3618 domain-containing protein [Phycicoccus sp. CSK15P-2]|uniref:DUF3618 domain-containing protein n=1 Tax=Phycicoccus sp. CSK15P-2 TaxID=2807627 RepID=UPI00194E665C|nr:DUF3618 domain-containing protein [Phycicoccus sp. CSK15P-2]MBM6405880.1 DUF3618 domain-containing protein [Phycicoccus sp. CSK15P-2]